MEFNNSEFSVILVYGINMVASDPGVLEDIIMNKNKHMNLECRTSVRRSLVKSQGI